MKISFFPLILWLCLTACHSKRDASDEGQAAIPADSVSVMTDAVNYRHDRGMEYTLLDLSKSPPLAIGGASVDRLSSGGEKGCCITLPKQWRPGIKVRVRWQEDDLKQIYPEIYTHDLEIPRYEVPGDLYVVFYADHQVEVVSSVVEPGHPDWRGKRKETPWEYCLATNEHKVCKAATAIHFDTASVGFCNYLKEEFPEQMDLCTGSMLECMKDYEDEVFCKNILWAPRKK